MLAWLRSWDDCVFGRKVPEQVLRLGAGVVRHDFHLSEFRREMSRRDAEKTALSEWQLEGDRRPRHKVGGRGGRGRPRHKVGGMGGRWRPRHKVGGRGGRGRPRHKVEGMGGRGTGGEGERCLTCPCHCPLMFAHIILSWRRPTCSCLSTFAQIILLCGPPGAGKTTLAHVLAAKCGYRAVEVNASDDRSASALTTRVSEAAMNRSVTADKRPVW